jgi:hypothetical protein
MTEEHGQQRAAFIHEPSPFAVPLARQGSWAGAPSRAFAGGGPVGQRTLPNAAPRSPGTARDAGRPHRFVQAPDADPSIVILRLRLELNSDKPNLGWCLSLAPGASRLRPHPNQDGLSPIFDRTRPGGDGWIATRLTRFGLHRQSEKPRFVADLPKGHRKSLRSTREDRARSRCAWSIRRWPCQHLPASSPACRISRQEYRVDADNR